MMMNDSLYGSKGLLDDNGICALLSDVRDWMISLDFSQDGREIKGCPTD